MAFDQTVARLVRRGGASRVYSYEPCALGTIDLAVRELAGHKSRAQDGLWAELRK